jgi:DNA-binding transcriptional LysR family regulator
VISGAKGLPGVELRHLAALDAVVREGSFARAAAQLGYTQSALSQQVSALERAVGQRLLERRPGRRPLGATEAGTLLLRHAERIVASLHAAEADLAALAEGAAGPLRVGSFQTVGMSILPPLLARFAARWPRVDVALLESVAVDELLGEVESGRLDLSFTALPVDDEPFASVELMRDPYVLIVPADSPLARRDEPPALEELAELPLVGYRYSRYPHDPETHLRTRGVTPRVHFRSDETATLHGLVAAGVGLAVLPRLAVNRDDDRIHALDLGGIIPPRRIGVTWHRDRSRSSAASAFEALAREVCDELAREAAPAAGADR